jgi:hypothetical protein
MSKNMNTVMGREYLVFLEERERLLRKRKR